MTPEEYSFRLQELYGLQGDLMDHSVIPAAAELLIEIKQRIVNDGLNSAGGDIGSYSTKPIYAGPDKFVQGGFVAQGKNNKFGITKGDRLVSTHQLEQSKGFVHGKKFLQKVKERPYKRYSLVKSNYEERKTMYLQEGYKELRDVQGMRTDVVNLNYSGELLFTYQMQRYGNYVAIGFTTEQSAVKREGLEKKYGYVFFATDEEKRNYIAKVNFLILRVSRRILEDEGYLGVAEIEDVNL
jgi:hypothetical protein